MFMASASMNGHVQPVFIRFSLKFKGELWDRVDLKIIISHESENFLAAFLQCECSHFGLRKSKSKNNAKLTLNSIILVFFSAFSGSFFKLGFFKGNCTTCKTMSHFKTAKTVKFNLQLNTVSINLQFANFVNTNQSRSRKIRFTHSTDYVVTLQNSLSRTQCKRITRKDFLLISRKHQEKKEEKFKILRTIF